MAPSNKTRLPAARGEKDRAPAGRWSQVRRINRLKDDVYREMLLLEVQRPGSEMGLALALLRAVVQAESLLGREDIRDWLKAVCPVGLGMIEAALREGQGCGSAPQ